MKDRSHDEAMAEQLFADPDYAAEILGVVRTDGDKAELAILLRQIARAFQKEGKVVCQMLKDSHSQLD
ncbi:transcriptional regulator [Pseudomonas poae]|uniref:transcriptional regulator n=1 Tax=Pseudomonas poae TaxID=200451 RepID=UPI0014730580|nr:transcriptional regulator [Pseudomonas poae]NMZ51738.1 transcriptional regulator [Pseudomonas poae]